MKCRSVLSHSAVADSLHPMDCGLPGSSVHGDSPGKNTGVACHALLQGLFPAQGSNPGHPHCRQILYYMSHQGSPGVRLQAKCTQLWLSLIYLIGFLIYLNLNLFFKCHWFHYLVIQDCSSLQ